RIRTPIASAGAFSNSEFVHGTRYGLYGYVEVYTVLQPVAAMMRHLSPYFEPVAAHIMRKAVPSPQPAHEPAPPTYSIVSSFSIMSINKLSLMYLLFDGPMSLKMRCALRASSMTWSVFGIIFSASSSQTVTHSAQPLHLDGSMMIWNMPPTPSFFLPAS